MEVHFKEDLKLASITKVVHAITGEELDLDFVWACDTTGLYGHIENGKEVLGRGNIRLEKKEIAIKPKMSVHDALDTIVGLLIQIRDNQAETKQDPADD